MNQVDTGYLTHIQNTSISKECHRFGREERFSEFKRIQTDYNYNVRLPFSKKACNFGYGTRTNFAKKHEGPSPNVYNVRKFPIDQRSASIGQNRDKIVFGSLLHQIQKKGSLPCPGSYELSGNLENKSNFSLRKRLPDEIQLKRKNFVPGPGVYEVPVINPEGKYASSKYKNARTIFLDGQRSLPPKKEFNVGPGSHNVQSSDDISSASKIQKLRRNTVKTFGTSIRKGPEDQFRLKNPGPGMYETFSSFGFNHESRHKRSHTEA